MAQPIAGLDRRLAGDHVQQLVQHVASIGRSAAGGQLIDQGPQDFARAQVETAWPDSWRRAPFRRRTARRGRPGAPVLRGARATSAASAALRSTGSGTSNCCALQHAAEHDFANLLVQNPLVQSVLIDHDHAVFALGHQIPVVDLQRPNRLGRPRRFQRGAGARRAMARSSAFHACRMIGIRRRGGSPRRSNCRSASDPDRCRRGRGQVEASAAHGADRDFTAATAGCTAAAFPNRPSAPWPNRPVPGAAGPSFPDRCAAAGPSVVDRFQPMRQIGREELRSQRAEQLAVEPAAVLETDFQLVGWTLTSTTSGGISRLRKRNRIAAGEQQPAIGLGQGVLQRAIANVRPLRNRYCMRDGPGSGSAGRQSRAARSARRGFRPRSDRRPIPGQRTARSAARQFGRRRQIVHRPVVVPQREMHLRVCQRQPRQGFADVPHFGLRRTQKLAPHGRVEKQVLHFDASCPAGCCTASIGRDCPPTTSNCAPASNWRPGRLRSVEPADFGDRSQRFAAKPERAHVEQIVGIFQLAGGVAGDGQRQLFGRNAAAVVDDADQVRPPLLDRNVDARCAGSRASSRPAPSARWPAARSLRRQRSY